MRQSLLLVIGIALVIGGVLCVLSPEPASARTPGGETEIGHCDGVRDTRLTTAPGIETAALPVTSGDPDLRSSSRMAPPPGRAVHLTASPRTVPLRR